jgi:hypothetical protein
MSNTERRYLPTLADLVDRLTIVQQKMIFISERRLEYAGEINDILHDIDLILAESGRQIGSQEIRAISVIMLTNRAIWENESKIRGGSSNEPADLQFRRLRFTHSINGQRNAAKNVLAKTTGGRVDYKIDSLAADLEEEFGHWQIYGDNGKDT